MLRTDPINCMGNNICHLKLKTSGFFATVMKIMFVLFSLAQENSMKKSSKTKLETINTSVMVLFELMNMKSLVNVSNFIVKGHSITDLFRFQRK
jgi:hypothetical protein